MIELSILDEGGKGVYLGFQECGLCLVQDTGSDRHLSWTGSFHTNSGKKNKTVFHLVLALASIGLTFAAAGRGRARTPGLFSTPLTMCRVYVFLLVCQLCSWVAPGSTWWARSQEQLDAEVNIVNQEEERLKDLMLSLSQSGTLGKVAMRAASPLSW